MKPVVPVVAMIVGWVLVFPSNGSALTYGEYATAGFPCGTVEKSNDSSQVGPNNYVQYTVDTTGSLDICGQWFVTTSASIAGVPGSSLSKTGLMYASIQKQVPVPRWNETYVTNGTHISTTSIPLYAITQFSQSSAYVQPPPQPPPPPDNYCEWVWDGEQYTCNSPIVVDAARDGFKLTNAAEGVLFDVNADGVPEQTAWTAADSDDAWLAMDRNGNGRIDNGSELFGNITPVYATGSDATAPNGFEALKFLEWAGYGAPTSVAQVNEVIDAGDAAFARLLLWRDVNHNGISEATELTSVRAAGIAEIRTAYQEKKRRDRNGNEFRQKGSVLWADGEQAVVYDVWLIRK